MKALAPPSTNMHTKVLYILSKLSMTLRVKNLCSSANTLTNGNLDVESFPQGSPSARWALTKELQEERGQFLAQLPGATCNVPSNPLL